MTQAHGGSFCAGTGLQRRGRRLRARPPAHHEEGERADGEAAQGALVGGGGAVHEESVGVQLPERLAADDGAAALGAGGEDGEGKAEQVAG